MNNVTKRTTYSSQPNFWCNSDRFEKDQSILVQCTFQTQETGYVYWSVYLLIISCWVFSSWTRIYYPIMVKSRAPILRVTSSRKLLRELMFWICKWNNLSLIGQCAGQVTRFLKSYDFKKSPHFLTPRCYLFSKVFKLSKKWHTKI